MLVTFHSAHNAHSLLKSPPPCPKPLLRRRILSPTSNRSLSKIPCFHESPLSLHSSQDICVQLWVFGSRIDQVDLIRLRRATPPHLRSKDFEGSNVAQILIVVSKEVNHVRHTAADDTYVELDDTLFSQLRLSLNGRVLTRLSMLGQGTRRHHPFVMFAPGSTSRPRLRHMLCLMISYGPFMVLVVLTHKNPVRNIAETPIFFRVGSCSFQTTGSGSNMM